MLLILLSGGVLSQEDHSGKFRTISFFSSILNESQRKYIVGEKGFWAIVEASRKFPKYLQAAGQVIISSDHNPMVWLRQKRDPRGKFARWLLELEAINCVVNRILPKCNNPTKPRKGLSQPSNYTLPYTSPGFLVTFQVEKCPKYLPAVYG